MKQNQIPEREPEMARRLADLTYNLSRCCTAKDLETFGRFGLSIAEGQFLFAVASGGHVLPSTIADSLGIGRSRATPLSQSLIEKGYLIRREGTDDRRKKTLSLSAAGQRIAREAEDYRRKFHARLLESFGETDRQRVLEVLTELHDKMTTIRQAISREQNI